MPEIQFSPVFITIKQADDYIQAACQSLLFFLNTISRLYYPVNNKITIPIENTEMYKEIIILFYLVTLSVSGGSYCPIQQAGHQQIFTENIRVGYQGNIALDQTQESLCYNYTLSFQFQNRPGVAIALQKFQSNYSPDLYFSIKPLPIRFNVLPFIIRSMWKYTTWTKFDFQFLVQSRTDIEAGYYEIDSGALAGCQPGKMTTVLVPLNDKNLYSYKQNYQMKANIFLHGFQISTSKNSPYEIQMELKQIIPSQGIKITISVTSATKVYSVHMSYIIYYEGDKFYGNGLILNSLKNNQQSYQSIESHYFKQSWQRFHGICGFIMNNPGYVYSGVPISFESNWSEQNSQGIFSFTLAHNLYQYISYQYLFIHGSPCQSCLGYNYFYTNQLNNEKKCMFACPPGAFEDQKNNRCINCPQNAFYNYNTKTCQYCASGQYYDLGLKICKCRQGTWNGYQCIRCDQSQGQYWNGNQCVTCLTYLGKYWNGYQCIEICDAKKGQIYNAVAQKCECPTGLYWNNNQCISCSINQVYNPIKNVCECLQGFILNANQCIKIQPTCAVDQYWNGYQCIIIQQPCYNGQVFNIQWKKCECPTPTFWNPQFNKCMNQTINPCTHGKIYNPLTYICDCPEKTIWMPQHSICRSCDQIGQIWDVQTGQCKCLIQNQYFNGYQCISCPSGKIYNFFTKSCECPQGQYWKAFGCVSCPYGQTYNFESNQCECPINLIPYNGSCISVPQCPQGQIYNFFNSQCECKDPVNQYYDHSTYQCRKKTPCQNNPYPFIGAKPNLQNNNPQGIQILPYQNCICPYGQAWTGYGCQIPQKCQYGDNWNGYQCVSQQVCKPGCFWDKQRSQCICNSPQKCAVNQFWNGKECIRFTIDCPAGTKWDGRLCVTETSKCYAGMYWTGFKCEKMSEMCPFGANYDFNLKKCHYPIECSFGQIFDGKKCEPYTCPYGQSWNPIMNQCACYKDLKWNGEQCLQCTGDRIWVNNKCVCKLGFFWNQQSKSCENYDKQKCTIIKNSNWNGKSCECQPGFLKVQDHCVCLGAVLNNYCDQCITKPNSIFKDNKCQCKPGYYEYQGQCKQQKIGNQPAIVGVCNVGTFYNNQQKKCLPCLVGCLSCQNSNQCIQCRPEFIFQQNKYCREKCGDGVNFVLQCDDDNNVNGDGCSSFCSIEQGYTCQGGSPNSPDVCKREVPSDIQLDLISSVHLYGKVILKIRASYLPTTLIESSYIGLQQGRDVLKANIIDGFKSATSIKSQYIPGAFHTFSITIQFGVQPIGEFKIEVYLNDAIMQQTINKIKQQTGESSINIRYLKKQFTVNPAYLSLAFSGTVNNQLDILK